MGVRVDLRFPESLTGTEGLDEALHLGVGVQIVHRSPNALGEPLANLWCSTRSLEEPANLDDDLLPQPVGHHVGWKEAGHLGLVLETELGNGDHCRDYCLMYLPQVVF